MARSVQFHHNATPKNTVNTTKESLITLEHVLVLRMTCLSALIYVSTNLRSYETSFDVHASRFQQIVVDAEKIHWIRSIIDKLTKRASNHPYFSRGPGIIQPLFLTAEKYRDSHWRRRAITCLSEAGLEGPFNGPREAAIALRIIQHEEAWPDNPPPVLKAIDQRLNLRNIVLDNEGPACKVSADIFEAARVNGCRMPPNELGALWAVHRFKEEFYRYSDVSNMPQCSQDDAGSASLFEQRREKGWEMWEEFIEYPSLFI